VTDGAGVSGDGGGEGDRVSAFAAELRRLRQEAGKPSFRAMAARSGCISHTTLHEAATGSRFPSWQTTREFVRACGGNENDWRSRWERAAHGPTQDPATGAPTTGTPITGSPATGTPTTGTPTTGPLTTGAPATGSPATGAAAEQAPVEGSAAPREAIRPAERQPPRTRPRWWPRGRAAAVVAVLALAATVMVVASLLKVARIPARWWQPSAPATAGPLTDGDASRFVGDITVPDGTRVTVNQRFQKVWAVQNIGSVSWHERYLQRMDDPPGPNACRTPPRVPIGDTAPGEVVWISVNVVAPAEPGRCWVGWKMVDESGRPYLPSARPIFFLVDVVPAAGPGAGTPAPTS
jgi:hypothetical protein